MSTTLGNVLERNPRNVFGEAHPKRRAIFLVGLTIVVH